MTDVSLNSSCLFSAGRGLRKIGGRLLLCRVYGSALDVVTHRLRLYQLHLLKPVSLSMQNATAVRRGG